MVQFLIAAKSMERKAVGFFAGLIQSSKCFLRFLPRSRLVVFTRTAVPVARAADYAERAAGRVSLSQDDPCLLVGYDTKFKSEFSPKMQIMLPKSVGSFVAEVVEVISDTELRIKKEFGGESGKGTNKIREKLKELEAQGIKGLEYKKMPYVNQQQMYHKVYQCLTNGGCIGIFPEGMPLHSHICLH